MPPQCTLSAPDRNLAGLTRESLLAKPLANNTRGRLTTVPEVVARLVVYLVLRQLPQDEDPNRNLRAVSWGPLQHLYASVAYQHASIRKGFKWSDARNVPDDLAAAVKPDPPPSTLHVVIPMHQEHGNVMF